MDQRTPLVTIGIPTYNGARYLAASIDSLLSQDYPNFELVISDNCSTDDTEAIARAYVQRSDRIRYVRQEANMGAFANFNRVLGLAGGAYFMWASDHDLWDTAFVSRCVAALEADPAAVLAYPKSMLIDEDGAAIEEMDDQIDLGQLTPLARYKHLIWRLTICNMIYGVARREALAATGGFPDVLGPDHVVLARLALQGPILRVGGHLYLRRQNRPPETPDEHRRRALIDLEPSQARARAAMPALILYRDLRAHHLRAVSESSMTSRQKLDARMATLACFHMRFGVASNLVRLLRLGARATRQTARLERSWGRGD
ncbi:MAG TPA: glycosyltransferase family 2 protein [Candidatus Limnocylindrales bacterium]